MYNENQKKNAWLFKNQNEAKDIWKLEFLQQEASQFSYLWQFYFVLANDLYENLMT